MEKNMKRRSDYDTLKNEPKMSIAETREAYRKAKDLLENGSRCIMCDTVKKKDKFYVNTNPLCKCDVTQICKECARKIALRVDKNGGEHEPTKESCIEALRWLNKPFLDSVWNASIQESENLVSGKVRTNVWVSYIKNIAMVQHVGKSFKDSDFFKEKIIYDDELTEEDVIESHKGQDTYDSFLKNKSDVVRLLDYDPFENELVSDQPFLYSQLLGLLDTGGAEVNEDMIRTASAISIARGFLQASKIDDSVSKLMSDIKQLEHNSATIKSLQESKAKIMSTIKDLAAESCLSLKNSRNASKGDNSWTGKVKKIKDLDLRNCQVNGFDIGTCRGMKQVIELSDAAIFKQLQLDDSEWSDIVAEMREKNQTIMQELEHYKEINRILLQENLDLKDYLEDKGINIDINVQNLSDLYSVFADKDGGDEDESDNSSS